jgi:restriction system protein
MAIPDYQSLMLPFLKLLADGAEHTLPVVTETLAVEFSLTEAERHKLLPSGNQGIMRNRVGWARTYLKKALLLEAPRGAVLKISEGRLENITLTELRDMMLTKLLSGVLSLEEGA